MSTNRKPVAVVIGATSKWQSDGRNTQLVHGGEIDDSDLPVGVRWGVGGAVAQKFAQEGFLTVLTTRNAANAAPLQAAINEQGGDSTIVELDLSVARVHFRRLRAHPGGGWRPGRSGLQRGLHRRARPPAGNGTAGEHPHRGIRDRAAHLQQRAVPRRQGGVAGHARARRGHHPDLQQPVVVARQEAVHRPIALLSRG